jgi:cytidylate kinase
MSKRYYKSDKRKKTVIRKVIESLSYEGKRVIIGRGGFGVLAHHPSALHIKLHAPCQWRTEKIAERHGISYEDAKQYVKQTDESRLRLMNDFRSMNPSGKDFDVHFNCMSFSHEEIVNQLIELMKIKKFC